MEDILDPRYIMIYHIFVAYYGSMHGRTRTSLVHLLQIVYEDLHSRSPWPLREIFGMSTATL